MQEDCRRIVGGLPAPRLVRLEQLLHCAANSRPTLHAETLTMHPQAILKFAIGKLLTSHSRLRQLLGTLTRRLKPLRVLEQLSTRR